MRSGTLLLHNKSDRPVGQSLAVCRHRPIFPGRFQPSIFGTVELNYRVRDGNGWTLNVINTDSKTLLRFP